MLHVHRSDRADGLIEALRALLAEPPADPFAPELISVPTRGMERWLTQRLSVGLGICANVEFPFPRRLTGDAVAAASGIDPDDDPWLPERLVWPLLEVVERRATSRGWRAAPHLPTDRRAGSRPSAISRSCSTATRCTGPTVTGRRPLAGASCGGGCASGSTEPDPAARVEARARGCAARLSVGRAAARFSLFGLTRLPAGQLHVLRALAEHRDVHLFLLHPSPALWERIAASAPRVGRAAPSDPTARLAAQPPARLLGAGRARAAARPRRRTCVTPRAPGRAPLGHDARRACRPAVREDRAPRAGRRPTAASRSTPATAARARSRSCATRSCTCSRRTRRSSRAT